MFGPPPGNTDKSTAPPNSQWLGGVRPGGATFGPPPSVVEAVQTGEQQTQEAAVEQAHQEAAYEQQPEAPQSESTASKAQDESDFNPPNYIPKTVESLEQLGIPTIMLEDLIFKWLLLKGTLSGREIARSTCIPFNLLENFLLDLKNRLFLSYKQSTGVGDFIYVLSDTGRNRALMAREISAYVGPVPVPYEQYLEAVREQSIRNEHPTEADLKRAFSDLVLSEEMFNTLGPAIHSGRGLFLYGAPGNGKTSIAERICKSFKGYVFIPKALWVDGTIVQLFDSETHFPVAEGKNPPVVPLHDNRWVAIERPVIIVGGELTMESLEIKFNPDLKICEAPLQLKANNGIFMIDDFGRQRIDPQELLNRWIVPLEKKIDYLALPSGKKLQVPFDELILFSTNLDPGDLVDEAFLRRIPYKVLVDSPPEPVFRKLLGIMAKKNNLAFEESDWDYLIQTHYSAKSRPFRACQARDLMDQIVNMCRYKQADFKVTPERLDMACDNYFSVMT